MAVTDDFLDTGPGYFGRGKKLTGTIAISAGAITGTATQLATELNAGDIIIVPKTYTISGASVELHALFKVAAEPSSAAAGTVTPLNGETTIPSGTIFYLAEDGGATKGGINIETSTETFDKETDQQGKVGQVVSDKNVKVTIPFALWKPDTFSKAMPEAAALASSGANTLFRATKSIGLDLSEIGTPCIIRRKINGVPTEDPNRIIVFHNLAPSAETVALSLARSEQTVITASFMAWPNASDDLYQIGSLAALS